MRLVERVETSAFIVENVHTVKPLATGCELVLVDGCYCCILALSAACVLNEHVADTDDAVLSFIDVAHYSEISLYV